MEQLITRQKLDTEGTGVQQSPNGEQIPEVSGHRYWATWL